MTDGSVVRIDSEIGRLSSVICHTPGPELTVVTPDNRDDYLFDDLLDLQISRQQHSTFRAVLERFATVYEAGELFAEALEDEATRASLLHEAGSAISSRGAELPAEALAHLFVEGEQGPRGVLPRLVNEAGYTLPPLPNLFFTRDAAAVIGDRVVVAAMRHGSRWTEQLIMRTVFTAHPELGNAGLLYDGTQERRLNTSVEGGDLHVLRPDLLLVGLSERTTAAGIEVLTEAVFAQTAVTDVIVVILPPHRTSIHLDMIFTMIDHELCCVYPPYFFGPTRLPVLHIAGSKSSTSEPEDLFAALRGVDLPLEAVRCGGDRRTMQDREQWGSGCNLFCVGPGRLLGYGRNENTLEALEREAGIRTIVATDFLEADEMLAAEERFVIAFEGSELVRGGGGPRCMTLPVTREEP